MANKNIVTINGTDIGNDFGLGVLINYRVPIQNYTIARDRAEIRVTKAVNNTLTISIGNSVVITRGPTLGSENNIFNGTITRISDENGILLLECRDPLWRLLNTYDTKSYDINIDPEAGKISAIWLDLMTDNGFATASAVDSGTITTLKKFVLNDDSILERCETLATVLDWQMYYDFINQKPVLEPKGNTVYSTSLTVGTNVVNTPVWNEQIDSDNFANYVKVKGAFGLGTRTETFSGDAIETEFILTDQPESTLVTISGVEKLRGQPGTTETFDYYIDNQLKKLIFTSAPASGTDNISIQYTYKIPQPVVVKDAASKELYTPDGYKQLIVTFDDIETVEDATIRANNLLTSVSTPPLETSLDVINLEGIYPGYLCTVVDSAKNRNESLVVNKITYQYPEGFDVIEVGSNRQDLQDFVDNVQIRLAKLERDELVNEGILTQLLQIENVVDVYTVQTVHSAEKESGTLYWNDDDQGEWDYYDWGDSTDETQTLVKRNWTNNIYFDDFRDDDYVDSSSTATVDTANARLSFTSSQIALSEIIVKDNINGILSGTPSWTVTGTVKVEFSNDGKTTWNEVTNGTAITFPIVDFDEAGGCILQENGDKLLQETGDCLLLDGFGAKRELHWRITETGASNATVTDLKFKYQK